jgi:hypothetical protein
MPDRIPLSFSEKPYSNSGSKEIYLLFPVFLTLLSASILLFYPARRRMTFPGRRRLLKLPEEVRDAIAERVYQILLMVGIFLFLCFSYAQASIALYSLAIISEMKIWPLLVTLLVVSLYLLFNLLIHFRMISQVEAEMERGRPRRSGDD